MALIAVTVDSTAAFIAPFPSMDLFSSHRGLIGNANRRVAFALFSGSTDQQRMSYFVIESTEPKSSEGRDDEITPKFIAADFERQDHLAVTPVEDGPEPQCTDIVRDLSGNPLTVEYFAGKLGIPDAVSYSCPESDSFRGLMSNACRIHLWPGGETAFYKRIVFRDHPHALKKLKSAPYKLNSDIQSYKVVTSFLSSKACQAVRERAGVGIPKCYDTQLEPHDDNPIDSKFSFLLEDFSPVDGWYQQWLLRDVDECRASIRALAKLHAFFWNGSSFWRDSKDREAARELEAGVWKSASYVQPNRNLNQCQNVAKGWLANRRNCEKELSSFDFWDDLGERLQTTAEESGRLAHPFAVLNDTAASAALSETYKKYRTFCHGDPKQANFLFRRSSSIVSDGNETHLQVGLIDFQWCGFGLAATDMAHFFTSAVHADRLVNGGERELLHYYFDQLQTYLVEYGAFQTAKQAAQEFSFETFLEQYETGVLDICRLVIAYAWSRFDGVEEDDQEGLARTMNQNSYNKLKPNVVWLMNRCDEIMKSRGY